MNKTITLIDLLDMNAKSEKMPSKIKFEDNAYKLTDYGYEAENGDELYGLINFDGSNLNETVEIIEDDDKLEKIEKEELFALDESMTKSSLVAWQKANNGIFKKQIDFLIDHINKIEEEMRK